MDTRTYNDKWVLDHIDTGVYCEIGALSGTLGSTTNLLEKNGWEGILVEPQDDLFERLKVNRPNNFLYNGVILDYNGEASFVLPKEEFGSGYASVVGKERIQHRDKLDYTKIIRKNSITINELFENSPYDKIDYLCLDCEGSELSILSKLDFEKYRIKLISVESKDCDELLLDKGYEKVSNPHSEVNWDNYYILKPKFCPNPFQNFELDQRGDVRVCCGMWVKDPIGNINESSIEEIVNSDKAVEIRESILDESFSFCNKDLCPLIKSGRLPNKKDFDFDSSIVEAPRFFNFMNDDSCNLSCPSCRTSVRNIYRGEEYNKRKRVNDELVAYILSKAEDHPDNNFHIHITGSGDPFASKIYREFLFSFDGQKYPNVKVELQTNGVMLTPKYWKNMEKIHGNITKIVVSFDAGTENTYNITRRKGDWKTLISNMESMSNQDVYMRADFVVQDHNYKEMPTFVDLVSPWFDQILFQRVTNWGHWDVETFGIRAIWKKDHPDYDDFIEVLKNDSLKSDKIHWGNVAEFFEEANK